MKPFDIVEPRVVNLGQLRQFIGEEALTRFPDSLLLVIWQMGPIQRGHLEIGFTCLDDPDAVEGVCTVAADVLEQWAPVSALREAPTSLAAGQPRGGRVVITQTREVERRNHDEAQRLANVVAGHVESPTRATVTPQRGILSIDFDNLEDLERITCLVVPGYAQ